MNEGRDVVEEDRRLVEVLSALFWRHVVLLAWRDGNVLEPVHTGVLVEYQGLHWVATCAHGLETAEGRPVAIIPPSGVLTDPGRHGNCAWLDSRDETALDLGFIVVEPDVFLDAGQDFIDLDVMARRNWEGHIRHFLCGFPEDSIAPMPGTALRLTGSPLCLLTELLDNKSDFRFTLRYRDRRVSGLPGAPGLSGSPVWEVDDGATAENPSCSLVGLLYAVDETRSQPQVERLWCTRIRPWMDILDEMASNGVLRSAFGLDDS